MKAAKGNGTARANCYGLPEAGADTGPRSAGAAGADVSPREVTSGGDSGPAAAGVTRQPGVDPTAHALDAGAKNNAQNLPDQRWRRSDPEVLPPPGFCGAETMARVLPMLLVPVPAEATGRLGSRAQLHGEQEVLGSLTAAGRLQVLSLVPGGRGGGGCSLDGPFRQFVWEDSHNSSTPTDKPRLLALSENYDLLIYEFNLKGGRCDGTILYKCSEEALQKLIEDQNVSISLLSLRILSFHNNTSLLFINKCIILHIMFPERDAEIRVLNYFTLPLPTQAVDSIIDMQLCRGILFVLSALGWIYIFDIVGGTHVAHVDLALHQEDICDEQQQEPAKISSFTSLKVSQDLDVVVIVSSSNSAIALNLNLYFRVVFN